jgi:hypothetical protein
MTSKNLSEIIKLLDFPFDESFYPKVDEDATILTKYFPFSFAFDNSRQATYNYIRERENNPQYAKN